MSQCIEQENIQDTGLFLDNVTIAQWDQEHSNNVKSFLDTICCQGFTLNETKPFLLRRIIEF